MSCFGGRMQEYDRVSLDRFDGKNLQSTVYFLSHLHEDHTVGLGEKLFYKRLKSNKDILLYCSEVTHVLLAASKKYHHLEPYIKPLGINTPTTIVIPDPLYAEKEVATVTLLPAFHCPGSVMILIEGKEGTVLYTGDFRWEHFHIEQMHHLRSGENIKKVKSLYVDTTFCSLEYLHIPSRQQCIDAVCQLVREWTSTSPKHVVNIYLRAQYGHEPLLNAVASRLGEKVHVNSHKAAIYERIQEFHGNFTSDGANTQLHACDKNCMIEVAGETMLCREAHEPDKVLVILPTTMYFTQFRHLTLDKIIKKVGSNFFRACYSFHSSYTEVKDLLSYLKPQKVYPSVKPPADSSLAVTQHRLNTMLKECLESGAGEVIQTEEVKELGTLRTRSGRQVKKRKGRESTSDAESLDFGTPTKVAKCNLSSSVETEGAATPSESPRVTRKGRGRGRGRGKADTETDSQPVTRTRRSTRRSAAAQTPEDTTPKKAKKAKKDERSPTPDLFLTPASDSSDQHSSFCGSQRSDSELSLLSSQKSLDHVASGEAAASWMTGSFLAAVSSSSEDDTGAGRFCVLEDEEQTDEHFNDVSQFVDTEEEDEESTGGGNQSIVGQMVSKDEEDDKPVQDGDTLNGTPTVENNRGNNNDAQITKRNVDDNGLMSDDPKTKDGKDMDSVNDISREIAADKQKHHSNSNEIGDGNKSLGSAVHETKLLNTDSRKEVVLLDSDSDEIDGINDSEVNYKNDNTETGRKSISPGSQSSVTTDFEKDKAEDEVMIIDSDSNDAQNNQEMQKDKIDTDEQKLECLNDNQSVKTSSSGDVHRNVERDTIPRGQNAVDLKEPMQNSDVLQPDRKDMTNAENGDIFNGSDQSKESTDTQENQGYLISPRTCKRVEENAECASLSVPFVPEGPTIISGVSETNPKMPLVVLNQNEIESGTGVAKEEDDDDVIEIVDLTGDDQSSQLDSNEQLKPGKKNIKISLLSNPLKTGSCNKTSLRKKNAKNMKNCESESDDEVEISSSPEWLSVDKDIEKRDSYGKGKPKKSQISSRSKDAENELSVGKESNKCESDFDKHSKFTRKELEERDEVRRQAVGFICETDSESDTDESSGPDSPEADNLYDDYVELTSDSDNEDGLSRSRKDGKSIGRKTNNQRGKGSSDNVTGGSRSSDSTQGWISTRKNLLETEPEIQNADPNKSISQTSREIDAVLETSNLEKVQDQTDQPLHKNINESDRRVMQSPRSCHYSVKDAVEEMSEKVHLNSQNEFPCSGSELTLSVTSTCQQAKSALEAEITSEKVKENQVDNDQKKDIVIEQANQATVEDSTLNANITDESNFAQNVVSALKEPKTIQSDIHLTEADTTRCLENVNVNNETDTESTLGKVKTTDKAKMMVKDDIPQGEASRNLEIMHTLQESAVKIAETGEPTVQTEKVIEQERHQSSEEIKQKFTEQTKESVSCDVSSDKNLSSEEIKKPEVKEKTAIQNSDTLSSSEKYVESMSEGKTVDTKNEKIENDSEQLKSFEDKASRPISEVEQENTLECSTGNITESSKQVLSDKTDKKLNIVESQPEIRRSSSSSDANSKLLKSKESTNKDIHSEMETISSSTDFEVQVGQPPPPGTEEPPKHPSKNISIISRTRRDKYHPNITGASAPPPTMPIPNRPFSMYDREGTYPYPSPHRGPFSTPYASHPFPHPPPFSLPPPDWNQYQYGHFPSFVQNPVASSSVPFSVPSQFTQPPPFVPYSSAVSTATSSLSDNSSSTVLSTTSLFPTPVGVAVASVAPNILTTVNKAVCTVTAATNSFAGISSTIQTTESAKSPVHVHTPKTKKLAPWQQKKAGIFKKGPSCIAKKDISFKDAVKIGNKSTAQIQAGIYESSIQESVRQENYTGHLAGMSQQSFNQTPDMSSIKANISALTGLSVKSLETSSNTVSSNSEANKTETENITDLVEKLRKVEQIQAALKAVEVENTSQSTHYSEDIGNADVVQSEEYHDGYYGPYDRKQLDRDRRPRGEVYEIEHRRSNYEYERRGIYERHHSREHVEHDSRDGNFDDFDRTDRHPYSSRMERHLDHGRERDRDVDFERDVDPNNIYRERDAHYGRERDPYYRRRERDEDCHRQRDMYGRDAEIHLDHERDREFATYERRERSFDYNWREREFERRYRDEEEYRLWVEERKRIDFHSRDDQRMPPRHAVLDRKYEDSHYDRRSRSHDQENDEWRRDENRYYSDRPGVYERLEDYPRNLQYQDSCDPHLAYDSREIVEPYYEVNNIADPEYDNYGNSEEVRESSGYGRLISNEEHVRNETSIAHQAVPFNKKPMPFVEPLKKKQVMARVFSRSGQLISMHSASEAFQQAPATTKSHEKRDDGEQPVFLTGMKYYSTPTKE